MKPTSPLHIFVALNGFVSVGLGALGAHALQGRLRARDSVDVWQIASNYQLMHVAASLALIAWAAAQADKAKAYYRVAWLWQIGCLLFSGSIYALALGGPKILGPITPLGGLAFLVGWALLAAQSMRRSPPSP